MKTLNNFITERGAAPSTPIDKSKISSRYPHVNMVISIINELKKHNDCKYDGKEWSGKDADLWKGAGQFLFDYMKELKQNEFKDIVDHFGWEDQIENINNINPAEISMCVSSELQK